MSDEQRTRWVDEMRDFVRRINGNIMLRLGDRAAANRLSVRDADDVQVASIDSDGNISAAAATLSGNLTAVEARLSGDVYPLGAKWGLARRFTDQYPATYESHFRTGSIPAGYSWAGSPFGGTPGTTYLPGYREEYLFVSTNVSTRYFLQKAVTSAYLNDWFLARFGAQASGSAGIRVDDGTDDNYYQCLWKSIGSGQQRFDLQHRTGGGSVTTVTGPTVMAGLLYSHFLFTYAPSPPTHYPYVYILGEDGNANYVTNGPGVTWTPARAGLILNQDMPGGPGVFDWMHHLPL